MPTRTIMDGEQARLEFGGLQIGGMEGVEEEVPRSVLLGRKFLPGVDTTQGGVLRPPRRCLIGSLSLEFGRTSSSPSELFTAAPPCSGT